MTALYPTDAVVDAESAIGKWMNSDTLLVGVGKPLTLGVKFEDQRSPGKGTYARVDRIGGFEDLADARIDFARLTFGVFAETKAGAAHAAKSLCNKLRTLSLGPPVIVALDPPAEPQSVRLLAVDSMTLPAWQPIQGAARYIVDAIVLMQPVP